MSSWSLHNSICASRAPYRAGERKERVGKLLIPKANKAMKSGNGSFRHVPAPLARQRWSREESTEEVPSARCSFRGPAGFVPLVLLRVPRRQQGGSRFSLGMWLQEREEDGCQAGAGGPGAAWACSSSCRVRPLAWRAPGQALLCKQQLCRKCFKVIEISVLK